MNEDYRQGYRDGYRDGQADARHKKDEVIICIACGRDMSSPNGNQLYVCINQMCPYKKTSGSKLLYT